MLTEKLESLERQCLIVSTLSKEIVAQSDYNDGLRQEWYYSTIDWQCLDGREQSVRSRVASCQSYLDVQFERWQIHIDIWTELFWQKAGELGIQRTRREPLRKVLERGRFGGIGEAIHTRYEWDRLLQSGILQQRYTPDELSTVSQIIAVDAEKRLKLLKKCLRLRNVASSDYLKYGEAIAYFTRGALITGAQGTLLETYFSKEEIDIFDAIWK